MSAVSDYFHKLRRNELFFYDGILHMNKGMCNEVVEMFSKQEAELAALRAVADAAGEALEEMKANIAGWRNHADGSYCQTYNKERGRALRDAADMLERDIRELAAALERYRPQDSGKG